MDDNPGPGRWERVHTRHGYHLALRANNEEPIAWSEIYEDPQTVVEALAIVIQSSSAPAYTPTDKGGFQFAAEMDRSTALTMAQQMITDVDKRTDAEKQ